MSAVPNARPAPADRKFRSTYVDGLIASYLPRFIDPDLGTIFSNAFPNTLDTTIISASANDSFVITGDIDAMWLRDSTNEVIVYFPFASQDAALRDMLRGVVMRQARRCVSSPIAQCCSAAAESAPSLLTPPYPTQTHPPTHPPPTSAFFTTPMRTLLTLRTMATATRMISVCPL